MLEAGFVQLAAELETRPELPHATCTIPIELFTGGRNDRTTRVAHDRATRERHDRATRERNDLATRERHDQVRLCRLFLLRRGARMALPERHTNSIQRLVSYRGRGWIHQGVPGGPAVNLSARALRGPQEGADFASHWDIVPAGVWHYPEADGGEDWATVTFHSAAEDEIVDETTTQGDLGPTLTLRQG